MWIFPLYFIYICRCCKYNFILRYNRINQERIFEITVDGKAECTSLFYHMKGFAIWGGFSFKSKCGPFCLIWSMERERRSQKWKRKTDALMYSPSKSPPVYSQLAFRQHILQLDVKHLHQRAVVASWQWLCVYLFSNWKPGFKPKPFTKTWICSYTLSVQSFIRCTTASSSSFLSWKSPLARNHISTILRQLKIFFFVDSLQPFSRTTSPGHGRCWSL